MNGIYFDLATDSLTVVASDGHKLVRSQITSVNNNVPASFILPKKPASLLKNILGHADEDVVIRFHEKSAEFKYTDGFLVCRLIEGRYPNYNSVIPQNNPNELTIDRKSLIGALRRVLPFASESSQLIRFHIDNGNLELTSEDMDFATSAKENVICDYNGRTMDIGYKGGSLYEILTNLDCDDIIMRLADPSRAGVIEPASAKPVVVGDNVLVGANAVIIEGVEIGEGAVVAAGSIVIEDVPANAVVAGVPAKIIKYKDEKTTQKTALEHALRTL